MQKKTKNITEEIDQFSCENPLYSKIETPEEGWYNPW